MPTTDAHKGELIRRAREARGWTQRRLAETVSVDPRTVRNWEKTGSVPPRSLIQIENAFRVPGEPSIFAETPAVRAATEWQAEIAAAVHVPILARLQALRTELDSIIAELGGDQS